ncbi:MAG TPA: hypothetical protein VG269_25070 [Tepidisphaeraceae bacterium]|jgi:hypothetical protein|nr:hypothetical protein [Tepidisphaeraceae bacterium]
MMEKKLPKLSIAGLNKLIKLVIADPSAYPQVKADWRRIVSSEMAMSPEQVQFFKNLPTISVKTIGMALRSAAKDGGKLEFKKGKDGATISLISRNISVFKATPLLKICSFDANFHNCKWFPGEG